MNTEDYEKIEELINKMTVSDMRKLMKFLLDHREEFQANPEQTVRKGHEEIFKQTVEKYTTKSDNLPEIEKSSYPEPIDHTVKFNNQF